MREETKQKLSESQTRRLALARPHKRHGGYRLPEYRSWLTMKTRCFNVNHSSFVEYGGRGITVCPEWRDDFSAFLRDMGPKPTSRHTLNRLKNDGNYEPGNVVWSTQSEQNRNRRKYRDLSFLTDEEILKEFVKRGLSYRAID